MIAETAFRSEERFTQAEFWRWLQERPSADINHYELINGRIVMTPPAGWPHGSIEGNLVHLLNDHVRKAKLGMVLGSSTGYDLPSGDTLEPDVSFISAERFAAGPAPVRGKFLRIVPNLAVEILSRSTSRRDRVEKKQIYERNRVDEYWIIDPDRREVIVYHLGKRGYGTGRRLRAARIPSRVLPKLPASAADLFD
jgi:Uma2 family endonuclease